MTTTNRDRHARRDVAVERTACGRQPLLCAERVKLPLSDAVVGLPRQRSFERVSRPVFITQLD